MKLKLLTAWENRLKSYKRVDNLLEKADQFYIEESESHYIEINKICAKGELLKAEASELRIKADKLWAELILENYGNIKLEWKNWNEKYSSYECHLENGEVYGFNSLE